MLNTKLSFEGSPMTLEPPTRHPLRRPLQFSNSDWLKAWLNRAYRALLNLKNLRILRWIDSPMPGLAWCHRPGAPSPESWIHPADEPAARRLSEELASGHARATLRLARIDGDWLPVDVVANIVLLDQHTTAGLFTLRRASGTAW